MHTHRFGRKLKLPSTIAIKHGILKMMLQDELRAQALSEKAEEDLIVQSSGVAEAMNGIETPPPETQFSVSERMTASGI